MSRRKTTPAEPAPDAILFTAKWSPVALLLQRKLEGSTVRVIDVDEEFSEAEHWRIITVPTVVLHRGELEVRRYIGVDTVTWAKTIPAAK